ncbi:hypothetical protein KO465_03795 [Candidatus Micrarchaeota archaeon]|nr:hypothetical protein [Candidatus Micrarchaeota archaeon]
MENKYYVLGLVLVIALVFVLAIIFMGPGSGSPNNNSTVMGDSNSKTFVMFVDPRDTASSQVVFRLEEITDAQIETRCIDMYEFYYGQPSEAKDICLQVNPTYEEDLEMMVTFAMNNQVSSLYYYDGEYKPIEMSANPAVIAGKMCEHTGCKAPELEKIKAKVYYANELEDKEFIEQTLSMLAPIGLDFEYEYVPITQQEKQIFNEDYNLQYAPVIIFEKASMSKDNAIAFSSLSPQLTNPSVAEQQIGWYFYDLTDSYIAEPVYLISNDHLLLKLIEMKGNIYVQSTGQEQYFTVLESVGVDLDYEIIEYNESIDINVDYLPALVITDIEEEDIPLISKRTEGYYSYSEDEENGLVFELSKPDLKNYIGEGQDKAVLDIYIMSQCPYGLQMQKAVIPVAKLFKDTPNVEINNKFVHYVMHGQSETNDNLYQYCVDKEYPDKLWDYIECYSEAKGKEVSCLETIGADRDVVDECVEKTISEYDVVSLMPSGLPVFNTHLNETTKYGITGSPGSVFNGITVNMPRNAEDIKTIICLHLKDKPAECDTDLSSYGSAGVSYGPLIGTTLAATDATCG